METHTRLEERKLQLYSISVIGLLSLVSFIYFSYLAVVITKKNIMAVIIFFCSRLISLPSRK